MTVSDDELRQIADEAAARRVGELGFSLRLDRAVSEGRLRESERGLWRAAYRHDPSAADALVGYRFREAA